MGSGEEGADAVRRKRDALLEVRDLEAVPLEAVDDALELGLVELLTRAVEQPAQRVQLVLAEVARGVRREVVGEALAARRRAP